MAGYRHPEEGVEADVQGIPGPEEEVYDYRRWLQKTEPVKTDRKVTTTSMNH
ncbi:hypothetical protein DESC_540017 [Desulfosarcina cetonica]|nr:hypothetical protein DESC_540017 [Desulfosarcina cetonica]